MAGQGPALDQCGPFADGDDVPDLAESVPLQDGVPGAADGPAGPQVVKQLPLQNASGPDEQSAPGANENARRSDPAGVLDSAPWTRGDQAAALTGAGAELSDGSRST